jgi:hypothetical protein
MRGGNNDAPTQRRRATAIKGEELVAMVRVVFTPNLERHIACPPVEVAAATVREALERAFAGNERARAYVLDDQSALRRHMIVFVDGERVVDRVHLSDPVPDGARIYVLQSLSGG